MKSNALGPSLARLRKLSSPLTAYFLVFAFLLAYLWPFARTIHGLGDEGLILHPAERILAGQVPYRDFFSELAPGMFYLQALWFELFGISIPSARIPALIVLGLIGCELLYLSRLLIPGWPAALPVLIYSVTAFSRWVVVSHHWYSLFFALGALILLIRFLRTGRAGSSLAAGLCTCAAGICMQSKGAFLLLASAIVLSIYGINARGTGLRGPWKGLGYYLAGAALPAIPVLYYFFRHDALWDMADNTFVYLWRSYLPYDYHPLPFLPSGLWSLMAGLAADPSMLQLGKTFSLLAWSLLIPFGAAAFSWRGWVDARDWKSQAKLAAVCFVVGLGLMFSEMHRFDFIHILFGTPVLLILAVAWLDRMRWRRVKGYRAVSVLLAVLAVFHSAGGATQLRREYRRDTPIYARRGVLFQTPGRAGYYQSLIAAIESRVERGSYVLCYPYSSMLYFLTATRNPTRFDYLLPGQTTSHQFEEVLRLLESEDAPSHVFSLWRGQRLSLPQLFPSASPSLLQDHPLEQFLERTDTPFQSVSDNLDGVVFQR